MTTSASQLHINRRLDLGADPRLEPKLYTMGSRHSIASLDIFPKFLSWILVPALYQGRLANGPLASHTNMLKQGELPIVLNSLLGTFL